MFLHRVSGSLLALRPAWPVASFVLLFSRVFSRSLLPNILSLGLIAAGQARVLAASDETFSIPANLHMSRDLQPRFNVMLAASPTFRSQCQRLADQTDLYVRLIVDPRLTDGPIRAQSVISRLRSGAVVAFVSIGASPDPAEWLAHEIEHVIEQLEGVKLHALAAMNQNVWRTSRDTFETDRAHPRRPCRARRGAQRRTAGCRAGNGRALAGGGREPLVSRRHSRSAALDSAQATKPTLRPRWWPEATQIQTATTLSPCFGGETLL